MGRFTGKVEFSLPVVHFVGCLLSVTKEGQSYLQ